MPTLEINGQRIEVGPEFDSLTREAQNATVDEIAKSLGPAQPGGVNQRAGSFATGVNTALGAPFDATAWLINKAAQYARAPDAPPLISKPFLGSEWIKDQVGRTEPKDALDRLLYATGEGVGSATTGFGAGAALQAAGRAPTVAKTLMGGGTDPRSVVSNLAAGAGSGAGGEGGAAAAGAVTNNDPTAMAVGRLLGGVAGAVPGAAANIRPGLAPPSATELKTSGDLGFKEARRFGPDIESGPIADRIRAFKEGEFGVDYPEGTIPSTEKHISALLDPRRSVTSTSELISRRNAAAQLAQTATDGSERSAAAQVRDQIDDLLVTLDPAITKPKAGVATPMSAEDVAGTVARARADTGAAMRSNRLTGTLPTEKAETSLLEKAQTSDSSLDKALHQEARAFLRRKSDVRGFSDEELAALGDVRDRDPLRWGASKVGQILGGSDRLGLGISGGGGAAIGSMFGLPWWAGAILGPVVGQTSQAAADALARRALNATDRMVRSRSPLFELMPGLTGRQAIARALVPGLLEPRTRLEIDEEARRR